MAWAQQKIRHYHNELDGLPEQLAETDGHTVWQARYRVWGNTAEEIREPYYLEEPKLRFQGQYLNRKTGLHFNTFRFYDPDIGRFTTPDSIGLAVGINLYQYAPNPDGGVDPPGHKGCNVKQGDGRTHGIALELTKKQCKQTFDHIKSVIKTADRDIFTTDRADAHKNRKASLKG